MDAFRSARRSSRKESTKALYRNLAREHLSPAPFGATPLDKLRKTHIDGLVVALRKRSLSDSTVRQVYTVLRAILDDAKLDGLIADNPAARMARPRVARVEARHLSASEVAAILQAAEGFRYRPVLALIAATGLRRGEALALRWEHINFKDGALKVAATLSRVGDRLLITEPKSPRSTHSAAVTGHRGAAQVPAGSPGRRAATRRQPVDRQRAGVHHRVRHTGRPAQRPTHIEQAAARAGIADVGVHTLRHSAAVAWLEAGVHIKAVADLLGHSSISITGDIYGHTSDATTRAAIDGLTNELGL